MSQTRDLTVALEGFSFLEGPRWHEGRLWVSDFYTHQVVAVEESGHYEVMAEVPGQPSGIGFLPDGRALIVSQQDRTILVRDDDGSLEVYADLSEHVPAVLNDLLVDIHGRAYVGNFGFDLMGGEPLRDTTVLRVDPDGTVATAADGLGFPNGMVLLPDGRLVVAETFANRLTSFEVADDGGLGHREAWAEFGPRPDTDDVTAAIAQLSVAPDGICCDAEGAIWVADAVHGRLMRVREGGEVVDEIDAGTGVFACMLGGEDGHTLYCCAAPSFAEHERRPVREAQVLAVRVEVPHGGLP